MVCRELISADSLQARVSALSPAMESPLEPLPESRLWGVSRRLDHIEDPGLPEQEGEHLQGMGQIVPEVRQHLHPHADSVPPVTRAHLCKHRFAVRVGSPLPATVRQVLADSCYV